MIWLILLSITAILLWYNFVRPMNHFTRMGVKQSKPWPFFGDNWQVVFKYMSFNELIEWAYNLYPNTRYSGFYQFALPSLILRDPDLIKQITIKDFDHFTDHRPFIDPESDPFWGSNLFFMGGSAWREMRATISGTFTSSKMKFMFNLMDDAAETFVKFFVDKKQEVLEVDMKDIFTRYTNDVIATIAFGIKVDSLNEPNNEFYSMGKRVFNFTGILSRLKFFAVFALPSLFKMFKMSVFDAKATKFLKQVVFDNINVRKEKGIVRPDMINILLETRKGFKEETEDVVETGFATVKETADISKFKQKYLTDQDVASQASVFFVAGFDSIATAMSFSAYELAMNKDVQTRLRNEIIYTQKTTKGKLTYEALLKMKYLDMVLSEVIRLWPPAPGIDRVCTKPYTIEPITPDEKPLHLKKGDILFLPIVGLMHDPEYFPEPEKFDPERFSDENKNSINPYTYIPFGSGPRNCIGSRFALLEVKVLLYYLLLNFEIELTERMKVPLKLDPAAVNPIAEGGFWLGLRRVQQN
ncbi:unnamed protein product [Ceutorhynchus assimilis]|uniref:Cytochrome P450 n=1 Tax=Ceutorhynchus assimilis TaxID=467358 RepID=A0A9N9QB06_9CUCU|nr:unnamed protein product [Ceutorhynchus assimilis]